MPFFIFFLYVFIDFIYFIEGIFSSIFTSWRYSYKRTFKQIITIQIKARSINRVEYLDLFLTILQLFLQ